MNQPGRRCLAKLCVPSMSDTAGCLSSPLFSPVMTQSTIADVLMVIGGWFAMPALRQQHCNDTPITQAGAQL